MGPGHTLKWQPSLPANIVDPGLGADIPKVTGSVPLHGHYLMTVEGLDLNLNPSIVSCNESCLIEDKTYFSSFLVRRKAAQVCFHACQMLFHCCHHYHDWEFNSPGTRYVESTDTSDQD